MRSNSTRKRFLNQKDYVKLIPLKVHKHLEKRVTKFTTTFLSQEHSEYTIKTIHFTSIIPISLREYLSINLNIGTTSVTKFGSSNPLYKEKERCIHHVLHIPLLMWETCAMVLEGLSSYISSLLENPVFWSVLCF